jgi:uncharacterized protein YbcI
MPAADQGGPMLANITNGLARLHTQYYGKGPTRAKSYLVNDMVICVLREGFTTVERTLIEDHRHEAVHQIRRTFQTAMQDRFTHVVEEATGRKVIAYMSQVHVDPDIAVELFMLEPSAESLVALHEQVVEVDEGADHEPEAAEGST